MFDVMSRLKPVGELYRSGKYVEGMSVLELAWSEVPEPKNMTPNVYMIIEYAVALSLKAKDLEKAWRWALLAPQYNTRRHDNGEAEFLVGKVAFEKGDLEVARKAFSIADKKSEGRAFENEDAKYKGLIS